MSTSVPFLPTFAIMVERVSMKSEVFSVIAWMILVENFVSYIRKKRKAETQTLLRLLLVWPWALWSSLLWLLVDIYCGSYVRPKVTTLPNVNWKHDGLGKIFLNSFYNVKLLHLMKVPVQLKQIFQRWNWTASSKVNLNIIIYKTLQHLDYFS